MSTVIEVKLKEQFGEEALKFKDELKSWATLNGFRFELEQADWLHEGKIVVRCDHRWVRIAVRTPEELGTATPRFTGRAVF